jgi:hypothetical protein
MTDGYRHCSIATTVKLTGASSKRGAPRPPVCVPRALRFLRKPPTHEKHQTIDQNGSSIGKFSRRRLEWRINLIVRHCCGITDGYRPCSIANAVKLTGASSKRGAPPQHFHLPFVPHVPRKIDPKSAHLFDLNARVGIDFTQEIQPLFNRPPS